MADGAPRNREVVLQAHADRDLAAVRLSPSIPIPIPIPIPIASAVPAVPALGGAA
jgi:hypothetical protein